MLNIVVCVSGGGTNLQAIIDGIDNGSITNTKIVGVISNNYGVYALERAAKAGVPGIVLSPKDYEKRSDFEEAFLDKVKELNPDLIVLAGFMSILSESFTKAFPHRIINVHPSLIPSFCGKGFYGLHVHEAALSYGVKVTGATVHFVNEIPDGGEIILQKAVEIKEGDTPEALQKRVMQEAEWNILPEAVSLFCQDRLTVENNIVHIGG